jgi:ParB family chromosome partitioning protein
LEIIEKGVSVRKAEQMTKANISDEKKAKKVKKDKDHEVVRLEEELRTILGTKVVVDAKKKRGRLIIEYYSLDDLDRILEILRK